MITEFAQKTKTSRQNWHFRFCCL